MSIPDLVIFHRQLILQSITDSPQGIELKDIILDTYPSSTPVAYEKLDLSNIPEVSEIDPSILVRNLQVLDISDSGITDAEVLYYTVQVMALYNPVDVSYFKYVSDIKVLYNENDLFYRYITGNFNDIEEAYAHKEDLLSMGYPDDLFIKKVTRMTGDKPVTNRKYYTIQLKVLSSAVNINNVFAGLNGVREAKEMDGLYHYLYGRYTSSVEADAALERAKLSGFTDAYVREIFVLLEK